MMAAQTMSQEMAPISDLSDAVCRNLIGVMTDIDDTITTDGQLSADAYAMLERLSEAGLLVIPITGRPAGWCDMIARFWPVAGIVGENGALAMRYDRQDRKMRRTLNMDGHLREQNRAKLNAQQKRYSLMCPGRHWRQTNNIVRLTWRLIFARM